MSIHKNSPLTTTFRAVLLASITSCAALDAAWSDAEVGTIAFSLKMPGDMALADLNYTIVGMGSYQKTGTIPLSLDTRTFSATVAGIPVGKSYQLTLASTATDAAMSCAGAATFEIAWANYEANVPIKLQCHREKVTAGAGGSAGSGAAGSDAAGSGAAGSGAAGDNGSGAAGAAGDDGAIDVGGDVNLCPVIDGLYLWRESSGDFELSSSACDDDSMPAPLTYKWSVSKGTLSQTTGPIVTFTCPDSCGIIEVTLEVSDSECSDKWVEELDCDDKSVGPAKHRRSGH